MKSRLAFVDLMRGMAMLVMIEVHVVNSMLNAMIRHEWWYPILNFINGMVAPSFIFISGFAFVLASQKKLDAFRSMKYDFWRQLGRILFIWIIGYQLHVPYMSLKNIRQYASQDELLALYGIDVLQCIAMGLMALFITRLIIKSDRIYFGLHAAAGAVIVFFAPLAYSFDFTAVFPVPVAVYFTHIYNSNFPIFPWLGFMAFGAVAAHLFSLAHNTGADGRFMKRLLALGVILSAAGGAMMYALSDMPHVIKDIRAWPHFFFARLGIVFILLAACYYYARRRDLNGSLLLDASRETLLVYWLHLQILYRQLWMNASLVAHVDRTFGIIQCALATLLIIALMLATARLWGGIKMRYEYAGRTAVWAIVAGCGVYFFTM